MNKTIDEDTKAALEKMISDGVVSRESAAKYFPELEESEGEKTRKEIIAILKYKYEKFPKAPRYRNAPKWIVWLEKQGERKSAEWTEDDEIKVKAMCEEGNLKPSEREWLKNLRYRVTKKKSDVFTERDRNIINNICENIQGHFKFSDVCKEDAVRYLRSLEGRMQSKKGLTDEDYKVYKSIIDDAVNKDLALTSIQKEWLKSLKERVQPKQEWSEEDEKRMNHIIQFLEDKDRWKDSERAFPIEEDIRWLKDLKPQNMWQPSDEQMDALDNFIYAKYPNVEKHEAAVKSLYQDLKKLRGE